MIGRKTKALIGIIGMFVLLLCSCGGDRTDAKKIENPEQMPEIVFWSYSDLSDVAKEGDLQGVWTFCDKSGNFYRLEEWGEESWAIWDIKEQLASGELAEKLELRTTCEVEELFENHQKLCKISKNKDYEVKRPDSGPAVQAARGGWRGGYYDKDGNLQSIEIFSYDAHGRHNANDERANEILDWLSGILSNASQESISTPAPTATPVPTAIQAEGIAISEDNFGDTVFCEYLEKKFDADGNGFFSGEELAAIKEISFGSKVLQSPCTEIKGFSYFSELEYLTLNSAQRAEVCGAPKLAVIEMTRGTGSWGMGAVKYRLGDLWIADCPALEAVDIEDTVFIGKNENEAGELRITNCPLLRSVYLSADQLDRVGVRITETPMAAFGLRKIEDGTEPAYYVFDTHLNQSVCLPEIDLNSGMLVLPEQSKVEWVGADATSFTEELKEFKELAEKLQSGFSFEIQEVQPALRDEEGRVGYIVHLDNKYLSERNYHVYARGLSESDFSKNSEYYGTAMLLFCKEPPSAGEFSVEREKSLIFEADIYSPVNGVYGSFSECYGSEEQNGLGGHIVYTSGDRKEVLGELDVLMDFSVNREEGFSFWTGVGYEDGTYKNVTEGIWLEENTAGEALPKEDAVPVTEDYFTSLLFREFISDTVDLNRDGFLSREEREAVTSLSIYMYGIGPVVVDGLEYFPNLEMLCLPECREVVVRNCPKLKLIELTWCEKLVCQNCSELQTIEIMGDGTAEVVTEGCPSVTSIITNEDDVCHCE